MTACLGQSLSWPEFSDFVFQSEQTSGDDVIAGTGTAQSLFFGEGNDFLTGGDGNDVYVRPVTASGDDIIDDGGVLNVDRVIFEGITPDDITVGANGDDVVITFVNASSGTLTLRDHFDTFGGNRSVEFIEFENGEVWGLAEIVAQIVPTTSITNEVTGTAVGETLTGTTGNDLIDGLAGDDIISGGEGSGYDRRKRRQYFKRSRPCYLTRFKSGRRRANARQ